MSIWLRVIFASQWLLSASLLSAQVGFTMPVLNNIATGTIITPTVKVTGFDSIISAQYVICWDPQVLQFQGLSHYNLPGLDSTKFGFLRISQGALSFAWPSPNLTVGTSVPNGTAIFRLKMKVIGANGTGSGLQFLGKMPTVVEVTRTQNGTTVEMPLDQIRFTHGYVAVGYTVSDEEPTGLSVPLEVFPNPFTEMTQATFGLEKAAKIRLRVTDVAGRVVHEVKNSFPAGPHSVEIAHTQLSGPGAYFLTLQIGEQTLVRPIFLQ